MHLFTSELPPLVGPVLSDLSSILDLRSRDDGRLRIARGPLQEATAQYRDPSALPCSSILVPVAGA